MSQVSIRSLPYSGNSGGFGSLCLPSLSLILSSCSSRCHFSFSLAASSRRALIISSNKTPLLINARDTNSRVWFVLDYRISCLHLFAIVIILSLPSFTSSRPVQAGCMLTVQLYGRSGSQSSFMRTFKGNFTIFF